MQAKLFDKGRRKPRVMMHVCDAGDHGCLVDSPGEHIVRFECPRCGYGTGWVTVANVTEGKRGKPCPRCNESEANDGQN